MYRIAFILFFLFVVFTQVSCSSSRNSNYGLSQSIADSLRNAYFEDAARLALREQQQHNSQSVLLPNDTIDRYLEDLIAIQAYVISNKDKDSMFLIEGLHAFENPSLKKLSLVLDTGTAWIRQWQDTRQTSYDKANELIKKYDLSLESFTKGVLNDFAMIKSETYLNTYALSGIFQQLQGVKSAEPEMLAGSGQDINAEVHSKVIRYSFMVGAGDCPSGCIYKKFWRFDVDRKGNITYIGAEGHLPAELFQSVH